MDRLTVSGGAQVMNISICVFAVCFAGIGVAQARPSHGSRFMSAAREPGESYKVHFDDWKKSLLYSGPPESEKILVIDSAQPYSEMILKRIIEWPSIERIEDGFRFLRNARFLIEPGHSDFPRRSTWLYPDDGCFARADLARSNLEQNGFNSTNKIFVFGDLKVHSENSFSGEVSWWYHVAPIVNWKGKHFVFDPAVFPSAPILLSEWLKKMSDDPSILTLAICSAKAYNPGSFCNQPDDEAELAVHDQLIYLNPEWARQVLLGREPEKVLGNSPPWP